MKDIMKFKLIFLVIVGFLDCGMVIASHQPLLDTQDSNSLTPPEIGDISGQIIWMRKIATTAEADFNIQRCLHAGSIDPITERLDKERDNFLMNCHSAAGILKIEKDNFWHHDLPQCICCCCACLFRSNYALAQHNVIKAIAFVEKEFKQEIKR